MEEVLPLLDGGVCMGYCTDHRAVHMNVGLVLLLRKPQTKGYGIFIDPWAGGRVRSTDAGES